MIYMRLASHIHGGLTIEVGRSQHPSGVSSRKHTGGIRYQDQPSTLVASRNDSG